MKTNYQKRFLAVLAMDGKTLADTITMSRRQIMAIKRRTARWCIVEILNIRQRNEAAKTWPK